MSQLDADKGGVTRTVATRILVILALLCTATFAFPLEGHAAPPTRIVDELRSPTREKAYRPISAEFGTKR